MHHCGHLEPCSSSLNNRCIIYGLDQMQKTCEMVIIRDVKHLKTMAEVIVATKLH